MPGPDAVVDDPAHHPGADAPPADAGPRDHPLRYRGDLERAVQLARHPAVAEASAVRARQRRDVRRDLLGTALRLTNLLAPEVTGVVDHCLRVLGVGTPVEVYVYPSPQFNAGCTAPDDERVYVMLSSSLVDAFDPHELTFVVGHELGHHLFAHHEIPASELLAAGPGRLSDPRLALEVFAWQRCAEISADRAGLACTPALEVAGRAMFKLTSGLAGSRVAIDLGEFLRQASDLARTERGPDGAEQRRDWFTTHPFSPLRIRALVLASESPPFGNARAPADVDREIGELLALMEPRYTIEDTATAEAMRRLLFAGGIAIAAATGAITPEERAALEAFLGAGGLPETLDADAVRGVLADRIERVRDVVPPLRRHQVLRDLCVIAHADGRTSAAERDVLEAIARGIGLSPRDVTTALAQAGKPLD